MKRRSSFIFAILVLIQLVSVHVSARAASRSAEKPALTGEFLFPPEVLHNHGSCIVECPNGDLLVCWYRGSGERWADDVAVMGARRKRGERRWSAPFVMADTPGLPDTNPTMFIDPQQRLWLLWNTILDNQWESALFKYRIASDYQKRGAPRWAANEVIHVKPPTNFQALVSAGLDALEAHPPAQMKREEFDAWIKKNRTRLADKLSCRLGWMTRAHPFVLDGRRLIIPAYSDGFDFCLMILTDDWGRNWFTSDPLVSMINSQPSLVRKRDGTLVAYMRDDGPPPQRAPVSESKDRGATWSPVVDSELVDTGAGVEVLALRSGRWVFVNNDLDDGRHRLAVTMSDDEGKTWKWKRYLERDSEADVKTGAGAYHYPSVIQSRDGSIHVSYSFRLPKSQVKPDAQGQPANETIKHAHFNEAWVMAGGPAARPPANP